MDAASDATVATAAGSRLGRTVIPIAVIPRSARVARCAAPRSTTGSTCSVRSRRPSRWPPCSSGGSTPMTGALGFGGGRLPRLHRALRPAGRRFAPTGRRSSDRVMTALLYSAGRDPAGGARVRGALHGGPRQPGLISHLNFFTQTMELAGPLDPLDVGGIAARDRRHPDPDRHRPRDHRAARPRHGGVPQRDRRAVRPVRPDDRRRHDRAAVDRRGPLRLRDRDHAHHAPAVGLRRRPGDQHDDAADHDPRVGCRAAPGRRATSARRRTRSAPRAGARCGTSCCRRPGRAS